MSTKLKNIKKFYSKRKRVCKTKLSPKFKTTKETVNPEMFLVNKIWTLAIKMNSSNK